MRIGQNMKNRSFYHVFFYSECTTKKYVIERIPKTAGLLICLLMCLESPLTSAQTTTISIQQLKIKVADFLNEQYKKDPTTDVKIKVGGLDPRLHLADCSQSLSLKLQDPSGNGGNVSTEVACRGDTSWTILVPTQVTIYRPTAIASRDLTPGTLVTAEDLGLETLDVSLYRQGFSLDAKDIIGKEIKYSVSKGSTFRTSALDSPKVIKRGDEVTVEALAGSIRVIAKGTAVSDGRLGQLIRIRNTQSERILSAKVISAGKVQSIL
jgi:flagellar basal body P-ring formation protein FlgA